MCSLSGKDQGAVNRAMNNGEERFELAKAVLARLPNVTFDKSMNPNDVPSGTIDYSNI